MDMYIRMFLSGVFALVISCKKDKAEGKSPATDLLTQKEWVLKGYGYDENGNDLLDPGEEAINDCEKDNTYLFSRNGDGSLFENTLLCGNGITEILFTWKWLDNEKALAIGFAEIRLLHLSKNELIYFQQPSPGATKFITVLKH
jgi:hypothetical protein